MFLDWILRQLVCGCYCVVWCAAVVRNGTRLHFCVPVLALLAFAYWLFLKFARTPSTFGDRGDTTSAAIYPLFLVQVNGAAGHNRGEVVERRLFATQSSTVACTFLFCNAVRHL